MTMATSAFSHILTIIKVTLTHPFIAKISLTKHPFFGYPHLWKPPFGDLKRSIPNSFKGALPGCKVRRAGGSGNVQSLRFTMLYVSPLIYS